MNITTNEILRRLREMVLDSRDEDDPTFYHSVNSGAEFASLFDELDSRLSSMEGLPYDWKPQNER